MEDRVKFLAAFVKRPFDTGAVTPSSAWLAAAMVEGMELESANTIVELGPGTGPFTQVIEGRLKPDAAFLCFEINPDLAATLQGRFHRATIVNDSVENLRTHLGKAGRSEVDAV